MKKLLYAKDSEEFWRIFSLEWEKRQKKLANLLFARKIEILEKMQQDAGLLKKSRKASRTQ